MTAPRDPRSMVCPPGESRGAGWGIPGGPRRSLLGTCLLAFALASIAAAGACSQAGGKAGANASTGSESPVAPSFDPIVIPKAGGKGGASTGSVKDEQPVGEDVAGWDEKLSLASGLAAGGYDAEAKDVIQAVLDSHPPPEWAGRFQALRQSLRVRRIEETLVRVDARGERDYVHFGDAVRWVVRIRNVSGHDVVFPAPGGTGRSPSVLSLEVDRRDVDIYGAELRTTWSTRVALQEAGGGDVRIPAHRAREIPVSMPPSEVGGALTGLRILEMRGTLRVASMRSGEHEETGGLPVRPGRVVAFQRGLESLASDPLGSLEKARSVVAPAHLLVAAEFVPRERAPEAVGIVAQALAEGDPALRTSCLGALALLREKTVGRPLADVVAPLVRALEKHPARSVALMEALRNFSGEALPQDARLWEDWWRRVKASGKTVAARSETGVGAAG